MEFRVRMYSKLAPRTIESAVSTVRQLLKFAHEEDFVLAVPSAGRRLRCPVKVKYVPPVSDIGRLYQVCGIAKWRSWSWWKRFIVLSYTTGLRLSDLLRLERANVGDDAITIVAAKTGKLQVLPLLPCAAREVQNCTSRLLPCSKAIELIRRELRTFCRVAGMPTITPHAIRRCAANAYEAARPGAGALLLGHSLEGATANYIQVPQLLQDAAARLAIPPQFNQ